jgi:hypothetical protein
MIVAEAFGHRQPWLAQLSWIVAAPAQWPAAFAGRANVWHEALLQPGVTVRNVLPVVSPWVAMMAAVPAETAKARPLALTVANAVFDELQLTRVVILRIVPSE